MNGRQRQGLGGARRAGISVSAALIAVSVMAGGVIAGHINGGVKSYTGCLTKQGGTLSLVREGDSPAKACPSGSVVAHFSGGDITAVNVGFGLTGGGVNGIVTIALDPKYALRQDCADGQVMKWDATSSAWACASDDDTTYSAGTGLELEGTEFSLDADYRLPQDCTLGDSVNWTSSQSSLFGEWGCQQMTYADQDCPADEFVNGVDEFGGLVCDEATADGGGGGGSITDLVEFNQGGDFTNGVGIPDDGDYRTYASAQLGAGTWLIVAKGTVTRSGENEGCAGFCSPEDPPSGHAVCRLMLGDTELDRTDVRVFEDGPDHAYFPFAVTNWDTTTGATVAVQCGAQNADGVGIRNVRGIAVRIEL
ncbi:MAG: hypothetical protein FIA92_14545 [Chloroflexi bacterium]|nr:hypothetical protein [Chloroflexota bacterium]